MVEENCGKLAEGLNDEMGKLQTKFYSFMNGYENSATENKYSMDRIDRMYKRMKEDVSRHETLCFEIAKKFEVQHDVMTQHTDNIDALKTFAMVQDLHQEAYLPLQVATIAFEVSRGLASKDKVDKFKKYFTRKVFAELEKNCVTVCSKNSEISRFRKLSYKLPQQCEKFWKPENTEDGP